MPLDNVQVVSPLAFAAQEALDQHGGITLDATAALVARVKAEPELAAEVMEQLIRSACYTAVARRLHAARKHVWTPPRYDGLEPGAEVTERDQRRLASLASRNLLLFPLPGGGILGGASYFEILEAAHIYRQQATAMEIKAKFLELVAPTVPLDKIASDIHNETSLRELQSRAEAEAQL